MGTTVVFLLPWLLLLPMCRGFDVSWCGAKRKALPQEFLRKLNDNLDCETVWKKDGVEVQIGRFEGYIRSVADECYRVNNQGSWLENKAAARCTITTITLNGCNDRLKNGITIHPLEPVCDYYKEHIKKYMKDETENSNNWKKYNEMLKNLEDCKKFHTQCKEKLDKAFRLKDSICSTQHPGIDASFKAQCDQEELAEEIFNECEKQYEEINVIAQCVLSTIANICPRAINVVHATVNACNFLDPLYQACNIFTALCIPKYKPKSEKNAVFATRPTTTSTTSTVTTFTTESSTTKTVTSQEPTSIIETTQTTQTTQKAPTEDKSVSKELPTRQPIRGIYRNYNDDDDDKNDDDYESQNDYPGKDNDTEIPKTASDSVLSGALFAAVIFYL